VGQDSELVCGEWNGKGKVDYHGGLIVDSRWLGLAREPEGDSLAGFTASGSLYFIRNGTSLRENKGVVPPPVEEDPNEEGIHSPPGKKTRKQKEG